MEAPLAVSPTSPVNNSTTNSTSTRRPSHSSNRAFPLESISHASASRIGPAPLGVASIPSGDDLSPEEAAKRMAAYAAVDEHVKDHHKVLGIGGGGACHLREKVLAEAADTFILVADARKDSKILGTNWKQGVPIEVAPFAWAKVFQSQLIAIQSVLRERKPKLTGDKCATDLQKMGCEKPVLRMGKMKAGPVVTDNGNFVIDAVYSEAYMRDPSELLHRIKMLTGVLEVGIFAGMAQAAYFGYPVRLFRSQLVSGIS
ncbi:ribose 5-phosphate isomerase A, partial [Phenoliferia sp. Uapishka_3]